MTKAACWGKGWFGVMFLYLYSSPKGDRTGTHTRLEPQGRRRCRGHGGVLLIGLLHMASSACFLTKPSSGVAPPTISWVCLHQSLTKKMPNFLRINLQPNLIEGFFSIEGPSFHRTLDQWFFWGIKWPFHRGCLRLLGNRDIYIMIH